MAEGRLRISAQFLNSLGTTAVYPRTLFRTRPSDGGRLKARQLSRFPQIEEVIASACSSEAMPDFPVLLRRAGLSISNRTTSGAGLTCAVSLNLRRGVPRTGPTPRLANREIRATVVDQRSERYAPTGTQHGTQGNALFQQFPGSWFPARFPGVFTVRWRHPQYGVGDPEALSSD